MEYVIQTRDLTKAYGGILAVSHVDINVKKGDIYGFIGKNGAGKTTFLRMILGLAAPTSGEIVLFESKDLGEQRNKIGSIIETPALFPFMTASENMEAQRRLVPGATKEDAVSLIKLVGLDNDKKKKVKNYSLGMKQRLGIALALLGKPEVLLLDEPDNGLDPMGIIEIRELILKLNKENGITILISSHILGELSKLATRYGIIDKGVLIKEFTNAEIDTGNNRFIRIKTAEQQKVIEILKQLTTSDKIIIRDQNTILLYDYVDRSAQVNRELALQGVCVEEISVQGEDLESFFVETMGGMKV